MPQLHGYFRSTAAWRVRIALNLKGCPVEHRSHHLRHGGQRSPDYLSLNPQGLVPALDTGDGAVLTQSLAICEWLDETYPDPPLLPGTATERARIRAFALAIACDIHPVQNLKVLARLRAVPLPEDAVTGWACWVISDGLAACITHAGSGWTCRPCPACWLPRRPAMRSPPLPGPFPISRATPNSRPHGLNPERNNHVRFRQHHRSRGQEDLL